MTKKYTKEEVKEAIEEIAKTNERKRLRRDRN